MVKDPTLSEFSDDGTKGAELVAVLELAAAFPARVDPVLRYPPFGSSRADRSPGRVGQTYPVADQQTLVTLDLEGVLVPEIWIAVADRTGIEALRRTTRDEPDYDVLMRYRLDVMAEHGLTMSLVEDVIAGLEPLDGAKDFLDAIRATTQLIILSDTFEQFAAPLMAQLGMPTVFCHRLIVEDDRIVDYRLRQSDQKRKSVQAFHGLNYKVIAAGDSYNDTTMLAEADTGFLFHAPANVIAEFPQFPAYDTYDELFAAITAEL